MRKSRTLLYLRYQANIQQTNKNVRQRIIHNILIGLISVIALCVSSVPAQCKKPHHRIHKTTKTSSPRIDGIDVSHHNTVNWAVLKRSNKNIRFAYIKAIEGRTHKDPKFKKNVRAARKQGIKVGAYLLYSSNSTPRQQFDAFINVVKGANCNLIPAIDVEKARIDNKQHEKVAKDIAELSRLLQRRYGKRPLIYCHDIVYIKYLRKYLPHNHLWICNYRFHPKLKDHTGYVWQFTNKARIKGISGRADADRLYGSMTLKMLEL